MGINKSDLSEKSWNMDTTTTNSMITYKITTTTKRLHIKTIWILLQLLLCYTRKGYP